jgi:hypothetical protein
MTQTLKTLSALALVMAAVSATALVSAGTASANDGIKAEPIRNFAPGAFPGHGPVVPPRQFFPSHGNSGGHLISCVLGRGCTVTGGDHDGRDGDHDRDRDYGRDRWHDHAHFWNWRYPVLAPYYETTGCAYEYKFRSVYTPGFGFKRELVKVCEEI